MAASIVVVALIVRLIHLWQMRRAPVFSVLALYAPVIFFDGLIQKTVLDVFFVCLVLWISSRLVDRAAPMRTWLCLGLALGGLVLTT